MDEPKPRFVKSSSCKARENTGRLHSGFGCGYVTKDTRLGRGGRGLILVHFGREKRREPLIICKNETLDTSLDPEAMRADTAVVSSSGLHYKQHTTFLYPTAADLCVLQACVLVGNLRP